MSGLTYPVSMSVSTNQPVDTLTADAISIGALICVLPW